MKIKEEYYHGVLGVCAWVLWWAFFSIELGKVFYQ
jgi:hypothetical protein